MIAFLDNNLNRGHVLYCEIDEIVFSSNKYRKYTFLIVWLDLEYKLCLFITVNVYKVNGKHIYMWSVDLDSR